MVGKIVISCAQPSEDGSQKVTVSAPGAESLLDGVVALLTAAQVLLEQNGIEPERAPEVLASIFDAYIETEEEGS